MVAPFLAAAAGSSWAPAAIGAVGKLAGGLFGDSGPSFSDQRKHTKRMELARYGWLRDGALKAGFNPLTVLRATGGQMMQPQNMGSPLSTRAAIGEALETFAGTYAQDAIQRATEERAQEDWKDRYDYQRENPIVSPVSPTAAKNQETDKPTEIEQRQDYIGAVPNIFGSRPEDFQIPIDSDSPYAGQYVLPVGKDKVLMPKGWIPTEGVEGMFGELTGEVHGVQSYLDMGEKVRVTKDGVVLKMPKQPPRPPITGGRSGALKIDIF